MLHAVLVPEALNPGRSFVGSVLHGRFAKKAVVRSALTNAEIQKCPYPNFGITWKQYPCGSFFVSEFGLVHQTNTFLIQSAAIKDTIFA